jgi:uncharacterized membrane protein
MLPFFLSIAGLAIDGGVMFKARRDLQSLADSAARAAAMQVDQQIYRASSGGAVVIDTSAARAVASDYIASAQTAGLNADVAADQDAVQVRLSEDVSTAFMRIVHIDKVHVTAAALAFPRHGISAEQR